MVWIRFDLPLDELWVDSREVEERSRRQKDNCLSIDAVRYGRGSDDID